MKDPKLEIGEFRVDEVHFGSQTIWQDGILTVDREALCTELQNPEFFEDIAVDLARPGDSVRIIHVLDTLEPRVKVSDQKSTFPGFTGPPYAAGKGQTNRLVGATVMVSAQWPEPADGLLQPREAIIDMVGPGAPYSMFSDRLNIVLVFRPKPGATNIEYDAALRRAGLKAATFLGETVRGLKSDRVQTYELSAVDPNLPRIVYIDQVQSQGLFAQTYLYGKNANDLLPTVMHPNELLDGAIVSGNYVYGCVKNPTILHCNNPVVRALYGRHGRDLNFLAVIVSKGHNYTYALKERSANHAAKLAALLKADGAIITQEGGGNANIDATLTVKFCEQFGVKTTFITFEYGGEEGDDTPLVQTVPEADAIVSTGGQDHRIALPAMERAIGGDTITGYGVKATDGFDITLEQVYGATNQLGLGTMAAVEF